jgi:hypothetical protein
VKDRVIGTGPPNLYQEMDVYAWVLIHPYTGGIQSIFFPAVFVVNEYGNNTYNIFLPLEPTSSPPLLQYYPH